MSLRDYENTLKSYINDDDKLVTYKWLSKEIEVHVNVAKDILKQYWEKYQSQGDIIATYLLIGQLKDGSIRVEVVKDSNLDAAKTKFTKIDCEHLYSIQKSLPNLDLLALVGDGDLRYSAIKCNEQFVRDEDEIDNLRYIGNVSKGANKTDDFKKAPNKVPDKPAPKQSNSSSQNGKAKKSDKEKEKVKEKKEAEESKEEVKTTLPAKKVSPTKTTSGKNSDKTSKKPVQSKQTGFKNLFGKVPSKPISTETKEVSNDKVKEKNSTPDRNKKTEVNEEKEERKKIEGKENNKNNYEKDYKKQLSEDKTKSTVKSDSKTNTNTKKSSSSNTNSKKRPGSQDKSNSSKRKRIVVIESSEDESDKSSDNEEEAPMEVEEEPPQPVKQRSPSPPAEKRVNGKRMVKKLIDKTYKDSEGYLVTKRVHVYEAVEDDDKEEVLEVKKPPSKPKPADTKAKKQTTLMSFFKKS